MVNSNEILALQGITKRFGDVIANDLIDLTIRKGEIHTFLGENGAGKSTLVNIIYGFLRPDEGVIFFEGRERVFRSPRDAMAAGIGMVHQHFMLVPTISVVKNVILGLRSDREPFLNLDRAREQIQQFCDRYEIRLKPDDEIWKLSVGDQQWVEIIKALYLGVRLLVLDEPTAVMTPLEIEGLLSRIREMKEDGLTVIFISHKLDEVMSISDRITVFQRGRVVSTVNGSDVTKPDLARMMVGRDVIFRLEKKPVIKGKTILKLENVETYGDKGLRALDNVSLEVHEGEIFGIAGVSGNGQKELFEAIIGVRKITKGRIWISDKEVTNSPPHEIRNLNFSDIPDDKIKEGSILGFTLAENTILGSQRSKPFVRRLLFDHNEITNHAERLVEEYGIQPPSIRKTAGTLSGGNLQKLLLARELSKKPKLIVASQPTRGLDVKGTEFTRRKLLEEKSRGVAVLLISEDLDEIMNLCDFVGVIFNGNIVAVVKPEETSIRKISLLMTTGRHGSG
jgi:simple sugar transport system ATP-binding protein